MSQNTKHPEHEELAINTVEGLQAFLKNINDLYRSGLDSDNFDIAQLGTDFTNAYIELRTNIEIFITKCESNEEVTVENAETLQREYNTFVQRREKLLSEVPQETSDKQPEKKEVEQKVVEITQPKGELTKEETVPVVKKETEEKKEAEIISEKKQVQEKPREDTSEIELLLKREVDRAKSLFGRLKSTYKQPTEVEKLLLDEAKESIEQLEIITVKIKVIHQTVDSQGETKSKLLSYLNSIKQITEHLKEIEESLKQQKHHTVVKERVSKQMTVEESDTEVMVPISVSAVTSTASKKKRRRKNKNNKTTEENDLQTTGRSVSFIPTSVTTKVQNPVKRAVPKELITLSRSDKVHETESLTEKYLTTSKYRDFIAENFSSPTGFERIIDATITKLESQTIDHIEKWLGETHASAFDYLKDATIEELHSLSEIPFAEIKQLLQKENIKYETFVVWQDLLADMLSTMTPPAQTTLGELFARWMIEEQMKVVLE